MYPNIYMRVSGTNTISWDAGVIGYINDSGTWTSVATSAGSTTWTSGTKYVYWVPGATSLTTSTSYPSSDNVLLAIYTGGMGGLKILSGSTIIDGSRILTGTIDASVVNVTNISASSITAGTFTGHTFQTSASGKRVIIDSSNNELRCYDSSGVQTAAIGINSVGGDNTIGYFGGLASTYVAIKAYSGTKTGIFAYSASGTAIVASAGGKGVSGTSVGDSGIYGAGVTGVEAEGTTVDFASGTGGTGLMYLRPYTSSRKLPRTADAVRGFFAMLQYDSGVCEMVYFNGTQWVDAISNAGVPGTYITT